jgi:phage N-6-adenine-methyltransferase
MTINPKHSSASVEHYTPHAYIEAARLTMGSIDLDPATSIKAQQVVQASRFYTAEDDGLKHDWAGTVFLNPPYRMPYIENFVFRLCDHLESRAVPRAILLTSNNTDTKWWQRAATLASAICFTSGRISFYNQAGESSKPTNGQTFFYFGRRAAAFAKCFAKFGLCLPGGFERSRVSRGGRPLERQDEENKPKSVVKYATERVSAGVNDSTDTVASC